MDPRKVLDVASDADFSAIRKAYHKLCLLHHPDKAGNSIEVHERFVQIQRAYELLCAEPQGRKRPVRENPEPSGGSKKHRPSEDAEDEAFQIRVQATAKATRALRDVKILQRRLGDMYKIYDEKCTNTHADIATRAQLRATLDDLKRKRAEACALGPHNDCWHDSTLHKDETTRKLWALERLCHTVSLMQALYDLLACTLRSLLADHSEKEEEQLKQEFREMVALWRF
ncbi:Uu.00g083900.m01.CDS01 [Anthostomella pinea]|uniref:Uu.00g083900.m01.CDS01 n=1 Tax=Anthostomella pinea TaxID=933095 RepID=A0AAI8VLN7_9PEZI|nr:Uu.00g083900.m01.CDS01 [Anthostomella pinea]